MAAEDITDEAIALARVHEAIREYNAVRAKGVGWHTIRVSSNDIQSQATTLEIDGRPLLGVTELTVAMRVGDINRVTLILDAIVDLDLPADVTAQLEPCPWPHPKLGEPTVIPAVEDLVDVTDPDFEDAAALNIGGDSTGAFPDTACPCGAPLLGCLTLQGAGRGRCCESCVHN